MNAKTFEKPWKESLKPYQVKICQCCGKPNQDLRMIEYEDSMGATFGVFCPKCRGEE